MSSHLKLWKPIIVAALVAGTLDLAYAFIHSGPDGKITDHQMLYATILVHMFIVGLVIAGCARFLWPKELGPAEETAQ